MLIPVKTKGNFKIVPEGERTLTITKAECRPAGKPNKLEVTFEDSEGGKINTRYDFTNDKSLFVMGKMLEVVLGMEDGDSFDTAKDTKKLENKKVICEVVHTQGTKANEDGELPTFANIKKVIALVDDETGEVSEPSPRNAIANNSDEEDEDDLD